MKKSYQIIFTFLLGMIIFLIINVFYLQIINNYLLIIILFILLIGYKIIFGFERLNHRYTKAVCIDVLSYLLIFFIIYYLLGLKITYTKPSNYLNYYGIKNFIIPICLVIILKEILRYYLIVKIQNSKLLMVMATFLFILIDLNNNISLNIFSSSYNLFIFIAINFLPTLINNIICNKLTIYYNYYPCIIYLLITKLYYYFLPIIPNANDYLYSLVLIIIPVGLYFYINEMNKNPFSIKNNKHNIETIIIVLFLLVIIYYSTGYFNKYALAIGSGSMVPNINIGDVVIITKHKEKYSYQIGDIIAYKYHDVIIVHRIVKKEYDQNNTYYYTKGDDNEKIDNYIIYENMIIGNVTRKIPFLGLPSVWISKY